MFEDFDTQVDSRFFKHLFTRTNIPIANLRVSKSKFLVALKEKIQSRAYYPQTPRAYVVQGKNHLVSRIIPVLKIADACVYYYCIKKIESTLAISRVEDTYGGFSMGGAIRAAEDADFAMVSEQESASPYPFNPIAWVREWGDFQNKVKLYLDTTEYKYFIKFDIANFYDCINLSYLENKLRSVCSATEMPVIDILMYFLKNWNRDFENFKQKNIGLPQDEVGDSSRVLANFYLHEYDKYLKAEADKLRAKYVRYSDDQIIFADDKATAEKLLFLASNFLTRINLNLNTAKVEAFESVDAFYTYWSFDIYEKLVTPFGKKEIEEALDMYFARKTNPRTKFRASSVLRKITNTLAKSGTKLDINKRKLVEAEVTERSHVLSSKSYDLRNIYNILDTSSKKDFVRMLESLAANYLFNQFHFSVLDSKLRGLNRTLVKDNIQQFSEPVS